MRSVIKSRQLGGDTRYGSPGKTDAWQPVDVGFGRLLKVLTNAEQHEQELEHDEKIEKWIGNDREKFSAKYGRILIKHWVRDAFEKLQGSKYGYSMWRCFERTGCLITADGSGDDKIKPEGMPDYVVPPSIDHHLSRRSL